MMGLRPSRTAVEISVPVIWKAPSPTRTKGRRVGSAMQTPMPAGTPKPMER